VFECPTWLIRRVGDRQFERRFRYEIGIPPKLYARIVRFEAALRRKAAAPATQWTDIAHILGYHDQMLRCTWCTISTAFLETARQPSAVSSTCLCTLNWAPPASRDRAHANLDAPFPSAVLRSVRMCHGREECQSMFEAERPPIHYVTADYRQWHQAERSELLLGRSGGAASRPFIRRPIADARD
jgi:hypothetical protein